MLRVSAPGLAPSTEINGSSLRARKETSECLFGYCARRAWGKKADAFIAALCGKTDRQARDYLNGKVPVPSVVAAALLCEIVKRD